METEGTPPLLQYEVNRLRERLADQEAERDRERRQLTDQIDDLRERLDRAEEERRKLTAILTDQRKPEPEQPLAPPQPVQPASRGLLGWFRGRG